MVRMQVQLTEPQVDAVRRAADAQNVSQAEIIRRALDVYLARPLPLDKRAVRERARALIGAFASGESDVSARHDKYFADAAYDWHDRE